MLLADFLVLKRNWEWTGMAEVTITQHTLKGLEVKTAGVHYNINDGILYNMLRDNLLSR